MNKKEYQSIENSFYRVYTENYNLIEIINNSIEKLKQIKSDLDFEPWTIYQVKGRILFDLLVILENYKKL